VAAPANAEAHYNELALFAPGGERREVNRGFKGSSLPLFRLANQVQGGGGGGGGEHIAALPTRG